MTEEEAYEAYCYEKYLEDMQYNQYLEHQQEVEEYPLFFWRETCQDLNSK